MNYCKLSFTMLVAPVLFSCEFSRILERGMGFRARDAVRRLWLETWDVFRREKPQNVSNADDYGILGHGYVEIAFTPVEIR